MSRQQLRIARRTAPALARALARPAAFAAVAAGLVGAVALALPAAAPAEQAPADRPAITGIARVAFRVTALGPAREFYGGVLGLDEQTVSAGAAGARGCVRYRVNARQEIAVEPGLRPDEDERLSYLAFETPSLDALAAYFRTRGIAQESNTPRGECVVPRAIWVKDPDGHLLAFVEPQRTRPTIARAGDTLRPRREVSTRILHAGLTIRDAAAADAFYKEVLGFSEIWRGGRDPNAISWINMRVPNGTDYLEYMLVTSPVSRQQRGTLHHAALLVPDIQAAFETVTDRTKPEARRALASPQVGRNNRWQLNLYDPDGTRIELMEPYTMRSQD